MRRGPSGDFNEVVSGSHADELPAGNGDFPRELREWYRDFSRVEPIDSSPIAAAETQEFFYALQVHGMQARAVSSCELRADSRVTAHNSSATCAACRRCAGDTQWRAREMREKKVGEENREPQIASLAIH